MLTLRDYQTEAVQAVRAAWDRGILNPLVVAATGTGKTAIFCALLDGELRGSNKRALVLAHRTDLIEQPIARLRSYFTDGHWIQNAGIVMAEQDEPDRQIVAGTIQTLVNESRLSRILEYGAIDYLIIDEAHHAVAASYLGIYERLKETNPGLKVLGVTATPFRADERGLAEIFDDEVYHYDIKKAIERRNLAPVRWLGVNTKISLKGIKTVDGDYQVKGLKSVFETPAMFNLIAEAYKKYATGRQAIAFVPSVEGARNLADLLNHKKIRAAAASAETSRQDRAHILGQFARGELDVICNVALWTEGLDLPMASCILQGRPTKNDSLYVQIIGRALRTYPGKEDALIIDFAPAEKRNIIMAGDVLGIPRPIEDLVEALEETQEDPEESADQLVFAGFTYDGAFQFLDGSPADLVARQLDYLDASPWSWHRATDGWMSLGLGVGSDMRERILMMSPPSGDSENWKLIGLARFNNEQERDRGEWTSRILKVGSLDDLQIESDRICARWGQPALAAKQLAWRSQAPSEAQIKYAKRFKGAWKAGRSRGQVAQAITHGIALQVIRSLE